MTKDERKVVSGLVFKSGLAMVFAGISIGALLIGLLKLPVDVVAAFGILAAVVKFWPWKPEQEYFKELEKDEEE